MNQPINKARIEVLGTAFVFSLLTHGYNASNPLIGLSMLELGTSSSVSARFSKQAIELVLSAQHVLHALKNTPPGALQNLRQVERARRISHEQRWNELARTLDPLCPECESPRAIAAVTDLVNVAVGAGLAPDDPHAGLALIGTALAGLSNHPRSSARTLVQAEVLAIEMVHAIKTQLDN